MGRRPSGEGSVYQRSDGRWVASLMHEGRRYTAYARTEREAKGKLRTLREKAYLSARSARTMGRHTLAELLDTWLTTDPSLRENTVLRYRQSLALHILPALGDMRLDKITPERIQAVYVGLTPAQIDRMHRTLHRAFEIAIRWRWVNENPCKRVTRPRYEPKRRPMWSADDLQTFLAGIEGYWYAPLFVLLVSTGLRIGEALALTWENAGLGVAINVNGTLYRMEGESRVGQPKTARARRTVLLPPMAVAALQAQRRQQDSWREAVRNQWTESGFVFTNATGEPLQHGTVLKSLHSACRRLGIPDITPHFLRHLHASLLLHENVPIPAISARLGHANPGITMEIYAHELPGQDHLAADAIERFLQLPRLSTLPNRDHAQANDEQKDDEQNG